MSKRATGCSDTSNFFGEENAAILCCWCGYLLHLKASSRPNCHPEHARSVIKTLQSPIRP